MSLKPEDIERFEKIQEEHFAQMRKMREEYENIRSEFAKVINHEKEEALSTSSLEILNSIKGRLYCCYHALMHGDVESSEVRKMIADQLSDIGYIVDDLITKESHHDYTENEELSD